MTETVRLPRKLSKERKPALPKGSEHTSPCTKRAMA
ncbi:hypothetical protein V1292_001533 [Bradyrhizobium sp. AZCC 1719]